MMHEPPEGPGRSVSVFRQSELLFETLIENVHDVIGMLDAEGRVLYVSPGVRQYGRAPEQIRGESVWNALHPDDLDSVRRRFVELLQTPGATEQLEYRISTLQGEWRWKRVVLQNLLDEPAVRAVVANVHDFTEQRLAEEALRRSEQRFRSVVQDQTEFIVRWLPDGTRTFVNASYCRFFGLTPEQAIGQSFFPLVCDEDRARIRSLLEQVTPSQPTVQYEHRVFRPDGSIRWTQWNDRAIFDDQARLVEIQSVGRDITPQREAEERLRQQEQMLAHAGRLSVMGEMVAAIAHEIGQPLHVISTLAVASQKTLSANRPDSAAKAIDWAVKIEQQVQRTMDIIHRLREFTRMATPVRDPIDLQTAIVESLELVASDLRRRQVRVETVLAPALPPVLADRLQIEQVLVNLLRNAAEAMDGTAVPERELQVRAGGENGHVLIHVRDTGVGMNDEALTQIGKAFYTTKQDGTGIGLAISRRILTEHGSELRIARNPDRGMTFSFALPAADVATGGGSE